ncbi:hypothetical protein ATCC90586_011996 [Pythium insidiosum]|nr:hypothetical protein ATCC90586_011996 [Pythium insidiosum]
MVKHGLKRSRIYDYVLEKGENLIMFDVNNIVNTYRAQATDMNDDDSTAVALSEFSAAGAKNVVTVDETARGETGVIGITDMAVAVRAEDQDEVKMLPSMILSKFPYDVVASLGTDYHYQMLYRLQPPHYVSGALIRALCERLECHHSNESPV